jgi:hypothetical protein
MLMINKNCVLKLGHSVTEQRVTAQWRYAVAEPDFFCDHHWFGYVLLSFMHGDYV